MSVLLVETPDEVVIDRMKTRRICSNSACGAVYNINAFPPTSDGRCRRCGALVQQRMDDMDEKRIWKRLKQFTEKTLPAIQLLEARGVPIRKIPGTRPSHDDKALRDSLRDVMDL